MIEKQTIERRTIEKNNQMIKTLLEEEKLFFRSNAFRSFNPAPIKSLPWHRKRSNPENQTKITKRPGQNKSKQKPKTKTLNSTIFL